MANVTGTNNSERIDGADGVTYDADFMNSMDGDDTIFGLGGDDWLKGGGSADTLDGGGGINGASYADSTEGVVVDLRSGRGAGGTAEGDVLINIDNLQGSAYDDVLVGNDGANVLQGGGGDDFLAGGGGADTLDGGSGVDWAVYSGSSAALHVALDSGYGAGDVLIGIENVLGSVHDDRFFRSDGANVLLGGAGNDTFVGDGGADTLDGGPGIDAAIYQNSAEGVTVNLSSGHGAGGAAEGDVLIGIEDLTGSRYVDHLVGNAGSNLLYGAGSGDVLEGLAGLDFLYGGVGNDTLDGGGDPDRLVGDIGADLTGGEGGDAFEFYAEDAGTIAAGQSDVITDFEDADEIRLFGTYVPSCRADRSEADRCGLSPFVSPSDTRPAAEMVRDGHMSRTPCRSADVRLKIWDTGLMPQGERYTGAKRNLAGRDKMQHWTRWLRCARAWSAVYGTTLAVALVAFHVTSAGAEGIADRASIRDSYAPAPFSWTGFYVGGHVGHAWADSDWTFNNASFFNKDAGDTFRHTPQGGFGGGHIGFNMQMGRLVWGLEGTLSGDNISETSVSPFFPGDRLSTDLQTLWTVTGRLGYAWDRWMIYGKAGYAGGLIEVAAFDTVNIVSAKQAEIHHGWTAGLGIEYLLTQNLVLGLEYGYIDLGKAQHMTIDDNGFPVDIDNEVAAHAVMARLSYKFGR